MRCRGEPAESGRRDRSRRSDREDHGRTPTADIPTYRYSGALAQDIEQRWQEHWDERGHLRGPEPGRPAGRSRRQSAIGPKLFVLDMFPYPSGTGLHVGHPLGYIGTDVYGRYKRMAGYNVLLLDGLRRVRPARRAVRGADRQHPAITTAANIANMRRQLRRLGLSHDPRRSVDDHRSAVLPLDAVDLPADLQLLVRHRSAVRQGTARGPPDRRADRRVRRAAPRDPRRPAVGRHVDGRAARA